MTMFFMPVLQPTNPMTYNPEVFYNAGSAIVFGAGFAALSFRMLPPLSPAFRTRRLLALTLRDLRRLAIGRSQPDWQGRVLRPALRHAGRGDATAAHAAIGCTFSR